MHVVGKESQPKLRMILLYPLHAFILVAIYLSKTPTPHHFSWELQSLSPPFLMSFFNLFILLINIPYQHIIRVLIFLFHSQNNKHIPH
jgi:hypothetical protein